MECPHQFHHTLHRLITTDLRHHWQYRPSDFVVHERRLKDGSVVELNRLITDENETAALATAETKLEVDDPSENVNKGVHQRAKMSVTSSIEGMETGGDEEDEDDDDDDDEEEEDEDEENMGDEDRYLCFTLHKTMKGTMEVRWRM